METIYNFGQIFFRQIAAYTTRSLKLTSFYGPSSEDTFARLSITLPDSTPCASIIEIDDLLKKLNGED